MQPPSHTLEYHAERRRPHGVRPRHFLAGTFGILGLVGFAPVGPTFTAEIIELVGPRWFLALWLACVLASIVCFWLVWLSNRSTWLRARSMLDVLFVFATLSPWGLMRIMFVVDVLINDNSWLGSK